jgi:gamma-glutamylputrescine oxidase
MAWHEGRAVTTPPESYWLQTAAPFSAPAAELPEKAAVVILGGGIMGCSLAYWLAHAGHQPVLLERNPRPGAGATGRNGGLHVGGANRDYQAEIDAHGPAGAREILQATARNRELLEALLARENIACGYQRTGFLSLASGEAEAAALRRSADLQQADGRPGEWLDRRAAQEYLGTRLAPDFSGALFSPKDGVIHSARYTAGVAQAAMRRGARLIFNAPVEGLQPGPGGSGWRVSTPQGTLLGEQVAVTLNAWAPALLPELASVLTPVRGHIVLSAPAPIKLRPWGANHGYQYGRQLDTGHLLLGGLRNTLPDMDQGYMPAPGANAPSVLPGLISALGAHLGRIFPDVAAVPIAHHWTGVMDFSPDLNPLAGAWPGRRGLWMLLGFSGHGMPYSQVLPAALAAQMTGGEGPSLPRAFSPTRLL